MNKEIEQIFGGENAEEQNALFHVLKARGYDFLEKTPVTTMTVRLLEDLNLPSAAKRQTKLRLTQLEEIEKPDDRHSESNTIAFIMCGTV